MISQPTETSISTQQPTTNADQMHQTSDIIKCDELDVKQSRQTHGHGQKANDNTSEKFESYIDKSVVAGHFESNDDIILPQTIKKVPMVTKIVQAMNIIIIQMLNEGKFFSQ